MCEKVLRHLLSHRMLNRASSPSDEIKKKSRSRGLRTLKVPLHRKTQQSTADTLPTLGMDCKRVEAAAPSKIGFLGKSHANVCPGDESTHKGVNQRSKDVTQTQQQSPGSPTVTLIWPASKYKTRELHQRYVLIPSVVYQGDSEKTVRRK